LITEKPAEYIIEKSEYHNYAQEGILPIDSDILVYKQTRTGINRSFSGSEGDLCRVANRCMAYGTFPGG